MWLTACPSVCLSVCLSVFLTKNNNDNNEGNSSKSMRVAIFSARQKQMTRSHPASCRWVAGIVNLLCIVQLRIWNLSWSTEHGARNTHQAVDQAPTMVANVLRKPQLSESVDRVQTELILFISLFQLMAQLHSTPIQSNPIHWPQ